MRSAPLVLVGLLVAAGCDQVAPGGAPEPAAADGGAAGMELVPPPDVTATALSLRIRSGDDLQPLPGRVIITGVRSTPSPQFHKDGGTSRHIARHVLGLTDGVLLSQGEGVVPVPPGTYSLTFVQGPEYEQAVREVTVVPGQLFPIDVILDHSVRTDGWLAADMHIHSSRSFDSKLLPAHRVVTEVAAGVELLVPTDHVWHNDLQPYIDALGYQRRAVSIPGSEYGFNPGHLGVYPVDYDPRGALWGAPDWELYENWKNLTPDVVFPMIHALPEQPLVVVNHPRLLPDLGYFTNIGWPQVPNQPLATATLFDGMEVLNGYASAPSDVTELLRDWFFFLSQGLRIVGLGNSDSHRADWLAAGYPRTWLRLRTDEPERVTPTDLREALLGMRAVASNGPFVELRVDGRELGDTVNPTGGVVTIDITADSAGWIDLARVLLYQNGVLVKEWPIATANRGHPALRSQLTLPVDKDGWFVAMAVGEQPLPTSVIGAVGRGLVRPFALTNPVWIDADGDGKVRPPQLVSPPRPFGLALQELTAGDVAAPRIGPSPSLSLHPPLDCEPDAYLEWLERVSPSQ